MAARIWRLLGPEGPHDSGRPGQLGGHRRSRIYGRLDCPSALRAIAGGGYVAERVFFASEADAVACGYRPCGTCLPDEYRRWKAAGAGAGGELVTGELPFDGGRSVTVHVPARPADAIVFVADGGWHTARVAAAIEAAVVGPSVAVVGVHGRADGDGRFEEYVLGLDPTRFEAHEAFFVDEVAAWVAARFDVGFAPDRTAVWGASLGGELALALGLRHPDVFGVVLAASPGGGFRPPADLPEPLPRTYLVAGTEEPFFAENATRWADALGNAGADVVLTTRDGDHGGGFWFGELAPMLTWAFR